MSGVLICMTRDDVVLSLIITSGGGVEIELGHHFSDRDVERVVVLVNAVYEILQQDQE